MSKPHMAQPGCPIGHAGSSRDPVAPHRGGARQNQGGTAVSLSGKGIVNQPKGICLADKSVKIKKKYEGCFSLTRNTLAISADLGSAPGHPYPSWQEALLTAGSKSPRLIPVVLLQLQEHRNKGVFRSVDVIFVILHRPCAWTPAPAPV